MIDALLYRYKQRDESMFWMLCITNIYYCWKIWIKTHTHKCMERMFIVLILVYWKPLVKRKGTSECLMYIVMQVNTNTLLGNNTIFFRTSIYIIRAELKIWQNFTLLTEKENWFLVIHMECEFDGVNVGMKSEIFLFL